MTTLAGREVALNTLPKVVFTQLEPPKEELPPKWAKNFGYLDSDEEDYAPPLNYARWVQPSDLELAHQVEYDMDTHDQQWLEAYNTTRRRSGPEGVSCEFFEIVMDKLEKEWFDLDKQIPKPNQILSVEDSRCSICDDGECENSNAIVFCDGCNLAVHQDCYGVPYIPEGQWLCRKCTVSPDKPVNCILCPTQYGAFKQTTKSRWAHLVCAIWIPETGVTNTIYMEPVDGVEAIPKSRWKLICYLCKKKQGACIQCAKASCFAAFHVTCAREYGLELNLKSALTNGDSRAFCDRHGYVCGEPPTGQHRQLIKLPNYVKKGMQETTAKIRGPPLIPAMIFNRVLAHLDKVKLNKKTQVVNDICKYWSLKRENRRGAPLLKRLHLEPWTVTGPLRQENTEHIMKKLDLVLKMRNDLEKVRMLTELVRKREKEKMRKAANFKATIDGILFEQYNAMQKAFDSIVGYDFKSLFAIPVIAAEVPDYYDVIKNPMDWQSIQEKLDTRAYTTAQELIDDVRLVYKNARTYNRPDTMYHKAAIRMEKTIQPIIEALVLDAQASADVHFELRHLLNREYIEDITSLDFPAPEKPEKPKKKSSKAAKRKRADTAATTTEGEPQAEVDTEKADNEERRKRQKRSAAEVEDLGKADTFKHFETGWILPEGSSRRPKQAEKPIPKKKGKKKSSEGTTPAESVTGSTDATPTATVDVTPAAESTHHDDSSDLSSVPNASEDESEEQTIQESLIATPAQAAQSPKAEPEPMELDTPAAPEVEAPPSPEKKPRVSKSSPIKKTVVEGLKKEVRKTRASLAGPPPETKKKPLPSGSKKGKGRARSLMVPIIPYDAPTFTKLSRKAVVKPKQLDDGLLVWAKIQGSPWWPAEVSLDDDDVPPRVIEMRKNQLKKLEARAVLVTVMFFDAGRSWANLPIDKLYMLGDSDEFDGMMMSVPDKKHQKKAKQVREAYEHAKSLMAIGRPEDE